jgi:hypothetical protein
MHTTTHNGMTSNAAHAPHEGKTQDTPTHASTLDQNRGCGREARSGCRQTDRQTDRHACSQPASASAGVCCRAAQGPWQNLTSASGVPGANLGADATRRNGSTQSGSAAQHSHPPRHPTPRPRRHPHASKDPLPVLLSQPSNCCRTRMHACTQCMATAAHTLDARLCHCRHAQLARVNDAAHAHRLHVCIRRRCGDGNDRGAPLPRARRTRQCARRKQCCARRGYCGGCGV